MKKQLFKKLFAFAIVFAMAFSMFSVAGVYAQTGEGTGWTPNVGGANDTTWGGTQENIQERAGLGNDDPRNIAANVINIALGFLGILAVVLILLGGFRWMMAQGNDDKVNEARKLLIAGVTGLIIILAAYALAGFVLDAVFRATTSGDNPF